MTLLVGLGGVDRAAAQAQEDRALQAARARFELGEQHFNDTDYGLALREFQAVHEMMAEMAHPNAPLALFNIARCYEELGRHGEAHENYERFLAEAPESAPHRREAARRLRELQTRLELEGGPASDGSTAAEAESGLGTDLSPIGWTILSVGLGAVVAGALTGTFALVADADVEGSCVDGRCPPEVRGRAEEAQLMAGATDVLLVAGGLAAVGGLILGLVLTPSSDESTVTAACGASSCSAEIRGRF